MDIDVKNLHPLEVRLLRAVKMGEDITAERIIKELDYKVGQCNQAFSWLSAKGLIVEKNRVKYAFYELTDTGKSQAELGLPVERIFTFLRKMAHILFLRLQLVYLLSRVMLVLPLVSSLALNVQLLMEKERLSLFQIPFLMML